MHDRYCYNIIYYTLLYNTYLYISQQRNIELLLTEIPNKYPEVGNSDTLATTTEMLEVPT